jgi:hypothetical protein
MVRGRGREGARDRDERKEERRGERTAWRFGREVAISPGQRRRWNSSNRRIFYQERATTLDIQHPRSPTLASRRCNGIIADAARDRPSRLISCGEAERHRRVQGVERIERGLRELSGRSLERARENQNTKGTQKRWMGEGRYLLSSRKAAGLGCARLP